MPDWMEQAECAGWDLTRLDPWHDPELVLIAKAVCHRCPVLDECARFAVDSGMWEGVWGGMDVEERSRWAKRHGQPRHGTLTGYTGDGCRCVLCQAAIREYDQAKRPRKRAKCGTYTGMLRHYKQGTEPCGPCREAYNDRRRDRRRKTA